jgi:hypothetical protein
VIIVGAGLALVVLVAVVALTGTGGGSDARAEVPPQRCLAAWNDDPDAVAFGLHNYGSHGYERVLVTELTEAATEPAEGEPALCAVVFGALTLDAEPFAAGQLLIDGRWTPIANQPEVELPRLAELQAIAAGDPNASLDAEGEIVSD